MKSIGTKFSVTVGVFAAVFSGIILSVADAKTSLLATAVLLILLVGSILFAFRYLVSRREQETLKHLLQSSDHERQLTAYEIHDGLAQELAGAAMQLETYADLKDQDPQQAARAFEAGVSAVRRSLAEARRLIRGLRPPILDELGAAAAIAHLVQESQAVEGAPEITLRSEVQFARLAPVVENAIYRIVQEGLANALKHSGSKKVRIELVQRGDRLGIRIEDWGSGFTWDRVTEASYGLKGIQERARLLGGTAKIDTAPGEGTRITVDLPIV
jgi:signal transduction histidine kinase